MAYPLKAQYFITKARNLYFYNEIKKIFPNDTLITIKVDKDENHYIAYKQDNINGLNESDDTLLVNKYINSHKALFNLNNLINLVKDSEAIFYPYYNPAIRYDKKSADSITIYPISIDDESGSLLNLSDFKNQRKNGGKYFKIDTTCCFTYYIIVKVNPFNSSTKIKPVGIIVATGWYDNVTGAFIRLFGVGCFTFVK